MKALMIVSAFLAASVASAGSTYIRAPQIEKNGHFVPVTALCFDAASDSFVSSIPSFKCVQKNGDGDCLKTETFTLVIPRTEERLVEVSRTSHGDAVYAWQPVTLSMTYNLWIVENHKGDEIKVGEQQFTIPACAK